MQPGFLRRSTVGLSTLALVCTVLGACGGDLRNRYYSGPGAASDGGLCLWQGQQVSCDCRTEAVNVAVVLGFSSGGALNDADVDFVQRNGTTPSVVLPDKGSAAARGYLVASLRTAAGVDLSSVALSDPRGSARSPSRTSFVLAAPAAPAVLHVENWGTGQTVIDLDLRGHVQLLCIDRPCLAICSAAGVDGGSAVPVDAAAVDAGIVDAPASIDVIDAGGVD